jgi:hypothetical protein
MQLLERELGWVKVLDPATARQGWIYEKHIIVREGPGRIETGMAPSQQAAFANDAELGSSENPARSLKSQKSWKRYVSTKKKYSSKKDYVPKKRRFYAENRRRRAVGFFRFRGF